MMKTPLNKMFRKQNALSSVYTVLLSALMPNSVLMWEIITANHLKSIKNVPMIVGSL